MEEYKPNSNRSKEETSAIPEKHVEKIVTGNVKTKKTSVGKKLTDAIIQEDMKNVKSYVFMEVIIPALKRVISDIVTNSIDMILYGESGRTKRNSPASKVSYRSYYDDRREGSNVIKIGGNVTSDRTRQFYDYGEIVLENRGEAEEVLDRLGELIEIYKIASVADLCDLVGVESRYTDNKYGWTDIRNADIIRVRDGYLLKLPRPLPIN